MPNEETAAPRVGRRGATPETSIAPAGVRIAFQACKLVRLDGSGRETEFSIEAGETVVGASPDCDIAIDDETVSRRHFSIRRTDQDYELTDLDSTNGTHVDNVRAKHVFLRPGALIKAGDVLFRLDLAHHPADLKPSEERSFGRLLGESPRTRQIFTALKMVAPTEATVLIVGDTGTGKGAAARTIHEASPRRDGPFIVLDCGAVAANLLESELFGHERGAFTGAVSQRSGALEEARGGTLFIDELSDLSLHLQPKLLRALEDKEFTRVGSSKTFPIDCRVIAATQRELWEEVEAERFRRDLYFRLAVVTIPLPSLAERKEDIPKLVDRFLGDLNHPELKTFDDLSDDLRIKLLGHRWPGNVRELRNAVERICVMGESGLNWGRSEGPSPGVGGASVGGDGLELLTHIDPDAPFKDAKDEVVSQFERLYLIRLLADTHHNIAAAARKAGIGRRHLYTLLEKHDLSDTS